ncbi:MAG: NAD(P)H-dependent glycerol-3-phosphate dehydrogenase [Pseudomonadota bacterium]
MSEKIAVLGAGAWGTALAASFAENGHRVTLWGRDAAQLRLMKETRSNVKYLPGVALSAGLNFEEKLGQSINTAEIILLVIPAQQIASIAEQISDLAQDGATLISCAKGIDQSTGHTMSQVLSRIAPQFNIAALSGPSFAADVVEGLPTAVTIAAIDMPKAMALCEKLSSSKLRCYASDDLAGVDYGGALKNVLAIAAGIVHGRDLGASALAAITARGFAELQRMALALGSKPETLTGLSGLGDLILTCASEKSRNFAYGVAIGRGDDLKNMKLAEGVSTAAIAANIAHDNNIDAPIIQTVSEILAGDLGVNEAIHMLLSRPVRRESE